jgi:hypothetical protein
MMKGICQMADRSNLSIQPCGGNTMKFGEAAKEVTNSFFKARCNHRIRRREIPYDPARQTPSSPLHGASDLLSGERAI